MYPFIDHWESWDDHLNRRRWVQSVLDYAQEHNLSPVYKEWPEEHKVFHRLSTEAHNPNKE